MLTVSGPALVREACKAGIMAGLPRKNAGSLENFDAWLRQIRSELQAFAESKPEAKIGPIAVNIVATTPPAELEADLDVCVRHGVEFVVSAVGDPTEMAKRVHARGMKIFHDVTSLRFAEKAASAGVDGLICIGAGGGGHSGTISHLALIPSIRAMFDGVIVMAGAISTGAGARVAEILGADLAYMGTRFIATDEAEAAPSYKQMLVQENSTGLLYTPRISGVSANWLVRSLRENELDPANLPQPAGKGLGYGHLPANVRPWKSLWSAGQGIDLIEDVTSVERLVARLQQEYAEACKAPPHVGGVVGSESQLSAVK